MRRQTRKGARWAPAALAALAVLTLAACGEGRSGDEGTAGGGAVQAGVRVGGQESNGSIGAERAHDSSAKVPANDPGINATQPGGMPSDTTGGRVPNLTSTGEADRQAGRAADSAQPVKAGAAGGSARPADSTRRGSAPPR